MSQKFRQSKFLVLVGVLGCGFWVFHFFNSPSVALPENDQTAVTGLRPAPTRTTALRRFLEIVAVNRDPIGAGTVLTGFDCSLEGTSSAKGSAKKLEFKKEVRLGPGHSQIWAEVTQDCISVARCQVFGKVLQSSGITESMEEREAFAGADSCLGRLILRLESVSSKASEAKFDPKRGDAAKGDSLPKVGSAVEDSELRLENSLHQQEPNTALLTKQFVEKTLRENMEATEENSSSRDAPSSELLDEEFEGEARLESLSQRQKGVARE